MQILTAPPKDSHALSAIYARAPHEGMFFSGLMRRERFDIASDYDENWSCASITWLSGGAEEYAFSGARRPVTLLSAGALTLARGARYAYRARGEAPFRSSMITFPHWITEGAAQATLDSAHGEGRRLETRLIRPGAGLQALMDEIAGQVRAGVSNAQWHAEKCALLYAKLLDAQDARAAARDEISAVKASTRAELARRCGLAKETMLQRFAEPDLDLTTIAREARLSQYHLIRVFKTMTGATPMQFLTMIRMDAALRLLKDTKLPTAEIASAVGYGDRTAFFRAFRKVHGCAPSAISK